MDQGICSWGAWRLGRRFWKRLARLELCLAVVGLCSSLRAQPVYGLFLGQEFLQVGILTETNANRAAYWECWARGFGAGQVSSATALTPASHSYSLPPDDEGAYITKDYTSASARDADFPPGLYSLSVTGANRFNATVSLTESAAAYPAAPSFPLDLILEGIPPGQDLPISWQLGADAQATDVMMVALENGNGGFVYHTPWPGQPNALSGLATNATIPGSALTPGGFLELKLIVFRIASQQNLPNSGGLALAGSATVVSEIVVVLSYQGNDVALYQLLEGRDFTQQGQSAPVTDTNAPFAFEASVWASDQNRVTNATVQPPGGSAVPLQPVGSNLEWRTNAAFGQEGGLVAAFPEGVYRWGFDGVAEGHQTASNTLPAGLWPTPLTVANWTACQTNSFTNDLAVKWSLPANASTNDHIELVVLDHSQDEVFHAPNYGAGGSPLPGTSTQVVIPANSLFDGLDYQARLRYVQVLSADSQSLAGATGYVGRYAETRFPLGSRVAPPLTILVTNLAVAAAGQPYFVGLAADGGRQPLTWSLLTGLLPQSLSFKDSGVIQGTPYASGASALLFQVADTIGNTALQELTLSVTGTAPALSLTATNLPVVQDGLYYLAGVPVSGAIPPLNWSIASGQLPLGLRLDPNTGLISGIAQEAGSFPIQLQVQDAAGRIQAEGFTLVVPSVTNNPVLRITQFGLNSGPQVHLQLNTQPDELCTVEVSSNLTQWTTFVTTNMPTDGALGWPTPQVSPTFYRAYRGEPKPIPNPLNVGLVPDTNSTVSALLTAAAGVSVSLTNQAGQVWTLDVPTNAVQDNTLLQMTALQDIIGLPFQGGLIGGVSFGPPGLTLLNPATLTLSLPGGVPADAVTFGFAANGLNLHLYPAQVTSNSLVFLVTHFSGLGAGHAGANDVNNLSLTDVCGSSSAFEQRLAKLIGWGIFSPPQDKVYAVLHDWFDQAIGPDLEAAQNNDSLLLQAEKEFLEWAAYCNKYLGGSAYGDALLKLLLRGFNGLAQAYQDAVNASEQRCWDQDRPWQAWRMMLVAERARALGLDKYIPNFFDKPLMVQRFQKDFRFILQVDSSSVVLDANGGGHSAAAVRTEECTFIPEGDENSPLIGTTNGDIHFVSWEISGVPEKRAVQCGAESQGNGCGTLYGIYLDLFPDYPPPSDDPCAIDPAWNDPPSAYIDCSFYAVDPVKQMQIKTITGGWDTRPATMNWWNLFQAGHAANHQGFSGNDASGAFRIGVDFKGDDWDYLGQGFNFAQAIFTDNTLPASNGTKTENTSIYLHFFLGTRTP